MINEIGLPMMPLVSVCVPTYNAEKYIEETLRSIINQTYENIEIIIGDNASDDNTEIIVNRVIRSTDRRVMYYKNEENLGYSGNCNKLISAASGELIAIYHSDDIYELDIVERQVELLESNKSIAGCFTMFSMIDSHGNEKTNRSYKIAKSESSAFTQYNYNEFIYMLFNHFCNPFFCPSSMVRKRNYLDVGGFDEQVTITEDQDMWLRLLNKNDLAIINEKMVRYRIHSEQGSVIYSDTSRKDVSPMVSHLSSHLQKKFGEDEYSKMYQTKIDRLGAIDDLRLAFSSIKNNEGLSAFSGFITKSKRKYILKLSDYTFILYFVIQRFPSLVTFIMLRLMLKVMK